MQCVHSSRIGMCVASCSSLSLAVGVFLGPALTLPFSLSRLVFLLLLLLQLPLLPIPSSHPQLLPDRSTLVLHNFLISGCCTSSLVLQVCLRRSSHSLSLPAEHRTNFIETYPHVHGVHSTVHVQLDDCVISSVSNADHFLSSTTTLPACTTFISSRASRCFRS